ncbi:hypothetical protein [Microbacterium oxydans]|uniref:Uncharacterized protein n=2 Tax=Microbacterium TaxID=33882 RepID=A0A3Q9J464_9MICO|nr:hypothetical protein [Microbacterium oxydans]AZS38982.1 hypothetical protein CVS54_00279 [Microbacterium oxydans]
MNIAEFQRQSSMSDGEERRLTRIALMVIAGLVAVTIAVTVITAGPAGVRTSAAAPRAGTVGQTQAASFQSPIASSTANVGDKLVEYAENTEPASSSTTDRLLADAGISSQTSTESGLALDTSQAFTRATENGSLILRVPFVSTVNLLDISGYTVMFNPDGSIASRAEVVYQAQTEHSGRVALWQDGQLQLDQIVSDGSESTPVGTAQPAFNWNTLNKCLTSAGIAQWALVAIGVACGVICGATLGIGCAACVAAAGGIIGSTAGECVAKAMVS